MPGLKSFGVVETNSTFVDSRTICISLSVAFREMPVAASFTVAEITTLAP